MYSASFLSCSLLSSKICESLAQRRRPDKNPNYVRKKTKSLLDFEVTSKCHITEMILEPLGEHVTQSTLDDGETVMLHGC